MAKYTRRIKPKKILHRTITRNPFLNPRPTGGISSPSTPATKKQLDSFEAEYKKFINELKVKKEVENAKVEETPVAEEPKEETPVVEEETDISEEPVNEVPEQTETTEA